MVPSAQPRRRCGPVRKRTFIAQPRGRQGGRRHYTGEAMTRPIQATISLEALRHNLARARAAAGRARVWAVVKANAYGHGIERVFPALRAADGFALLDIAEAEALRALGWGGPIMLLEGCFGPDDLDTCERLNLWHVVHDPAQIHWLASRRKARTHRVFLKLNSGMNRLGFTPGQYRAAWQRLREIPAVGAVSHMTHFATADGDAGIDAAREAFLSTIDGLPGERSLCNSAALLRFGHAAGDAGAARRDVVDTLGDWVRPGIALYGGSPTALAPDAAHWKLQPAMSLVTRIIGVQSIAAGEAVGYGASFRAGRAMRIGVAALGYADGYPRHAPSGTPIVVDGVRTRICGRVSMDMVTVDLDPVRAAGRAAEVGSPVLCWGRHRDAELGIDEVAEASGTLGYELMCALARRVPVQVL